MHMFRELGPEIDHKPPMMLLKPIPTHNGCHEGPYSILARDCSGKSVFEGANSTHLTQF